MCIKTFSSVKEAILYYLSQPLGTVEIAGKTVTHKPVAE